MKKGDIIYSVVTVMIIALVWVFPAAAYKIAFTAVLLLVWWIFYKIENDDKK